VLVVVEDTGPGIPDVALGKIFKRFYSERAANDFGNNSGLGLAICREIMQRLGGDVGYLAGQEGGAFRVSLSLRREIAA
jgi:signal transduction histidine kinase